MFTSKMFRRMLIPSLISSVGLAFADMADAVVVGHRMGTVGLAAISFCLPFYMILNVLMHGLGIGGSTRYARLMGEGKPKEAVACFNRIMRAGVLIGLFLAVIVNVCMGLVLRFSAQRLPILRYMKPPQLSRHHCRRCALVFHQLSAAVFPVQRRK